MQSSRLGAVVGVAFLTLLASCATAESERGEGADDKDGFDVLLPSDLEAIPSHSALQAIRQLRPRWLHGRGPSIDVDRSGRLATVDAGEDRVKAYLDGIRLDLERLDLLPVRDIARISFLGASEATLRFGIDHQAGAILVTTRHR